jgi:3-hydroxyisobutyrate dehydrogenase-like beta-hydroxyacid dehydrogenase
MRIGFLGYGEAARAFHDGLARAVLAYDILLEGDDGGMAAEMKLHGASPTTLAGLAEADWIFSAVTADQSLVAVGPMLPHLRQGQVLIDINSVSPGRKRETAAAVEAAGARYLDMAVMAPVHPKKHATPVLLAGECATEMLPELLALGFSARVIGSEPGAATAIKMVRSLFVKGLEAITVETLLAAEASGCLEEIQASLSTSFPGLDWSRFADYQFERTTRHGKRRAAEMEESAATLDALGLHGALAREIAAVQRAMGAVGIVAEPVPGETVQQALRRRLGKSG